MHARQFADILQALREIINRLRKRLHKKDALLHEVELDDVSDSAVSREIACDDLSVVPTFDCVIIRKRPVVAV